MGRARWDTELGRLLWLDGRSDSYIASEMGVATNTVTYQRKNKWEKGTERPEPKEQSAPAQAAELSEEPVQVDMLREEAPTVEALPVSFTTPDGVYRILEEATKTKCGIEAICTADAILCLWNWDSADDLRRARSAITYLIKRLEG